MSLPDEYRLRAVDEVTLETEGLYRLRRSVHLAPLREVLEDPGVVVAAGKGPVVLPLSLLPKSPLLEFDVTGPDGKPALLVSRRDTSNRQTELLLALAEIAGVPAPDEITGLPYGLNLFTPGKLDGPKLVRDDQPTQLAYALELAHGRPFDPAAVLVWQEAIAPAGVRLAEVLGAPPSIESSSENPLLALLGGPDVGLTDQQVTEVLAAFVGWQDRLPAAGADQVLWWLATFGRRYYALIECRIDPDRPSLIKMTERRALPLDSGPALGRFRKPSWRFRCTVELETKEARSYHLRVRTDDASVALYGVPTITSELGEPLGANDIDGAAVGSDGYAIYTSSEDRPGHVTVTMPLRLSGDVRRSLTLVYVLAAAAAAVALSTAVIDKTAIGLITLPATFSATLLLVREQTTLSARMLKYYKWVLVGVIIVLWAASLGPPP